MNKILTNHDLPTEWWEKQFTREELRKLAAYHEIMRGRNKLDTAINIREGKTVEGVIATFTVDCYIHSF